MALARDHLARRNGHATSARRFGQKPFAAHVEPLEGPKARKRGYAWIRDHACHIRTDKMRRAVTWLAPTLRVLGVSAVVVTFAFVSKFFLLPAAWTKSLGIQYPYGHLVGVTGWGGKDTGRVIFEWGFLLFAALCACACALLPDAPAALPKRLRSARQWVRSNNCYLMEWSACDDPGAESKSLSYPQFPRSLGRRCAAKFRPTVSGSGSAAG